MNEFDDTELQGYLKKLLGDQANMQNKGMAPVVPEANPYQGGEEQKKGTWGTIGSIAAPVMKLGGMALSAAGMPYVGIPLSIAGSAVGGGAEGGFTGALKGAGKAGLTEAATFGMGKGISALGSFASKTPEAILTGSKLSAPLGAAIKSPEIMSSLGDNLAISDPLKKITTPYASMSGMDVMNMSNRNSGLFGGS